MSRGEETAELDFEVKHETENAWLVTDGIKEDWLPKSIAIRDENDQGRFTVPVWWAEKKGFV